MINNPGRAIKSVKNIDNANYFAHQSGDFFQVERCSMS